MFLGAPLQGASPSLTDTLPTQIEDLVIHAAENANSVRMDPVLLRQMRIGAEDERISSAISVFLNNCDLRGILDSLVCFYEGRQSVNRTLYGLPQPDVSPSSIMHSEFSRDLTAV